MGDSPFIAHVSKQGLHEDEKHCWANVATFCTLVYFSVTDYTVLTLTLTKNVNQDLETLELDIFYYFINIVIYFCGRYIASILLYWKINCSFHIF